MRFGSLKKKLEIQSKLTEKEKDNLERLVLKRWII